MHHTTREAPPEQVSSPGAVYISNGQRTTFLPNPVFKNFAISEEWPGGETQNRPRKGAGARRPPAHFRGLLLGDSKSQAVSGVA